MYSKKKQFDRRYLLILAVVIVALVLVVLSVALKKDRNLNFFERIAKDTGMIVLKVAYSPFNFIKDQINEMREKDNLYEKYEELKEKEEQMDSLQAENENLQSEINKLQESLDLNSILSDKVLLNATVVNRNVGYWYDEVTIDKGSNDGIEKNMAVITSKGLIGSVSKVSSNSSTIKLLSNENMSNKISVKIRVSDDQYVFGLISGYSSKNNTYTFEGISENVDIAKGADVVTTGMGDMFPSGIQVGKVTKVTTDNFDLSKVVEVEASVDFDDIDYVTVLKRESE